MAPKRKTSIRSETRLSYPILLGKSVPFSRTAHDLYRRVEARSLKLSSDYSSCEVNSWMISSGVSRSVYAKGIAACQKAVASGFVSCCHLPTAGKLREYGDGRLSAEAESTVLPHHEELSHVVGRDLPHKSEAGPVVIDLEKERVTAGVSPVVIEVGISVVTVRAHERFLCATPDRHLGDVPPECRQRVLGYGLSGAYPELLMRRCGS